MNKGQLILLAIVAVVVLFLASTLVSPILIVCEDTTEDASIDMAATFSLGGLDWIYPGSSMDAEGHTLHNVHINNPQDPYGAARDIMTYSYGITPHLVVRVTSDAAQAIFGGSIVDDIVHTTHITVMQEMTRFPAQCLEEMQLTLQWLKTDSTSCRFQFKY